MITDEQGENIKKIIGSNYSTKIETYLIKRTLRNNKGLPYSAHYIRNVVNGNTYNDELEGYIFDAADYYRKKKEREAKRRQKILKAAI